MSKILMVLTKIYVPMSALNAWAKQSQEKHKIKPWVRWVIQIGANLIYLGILLISLYYGAGEVV